MDLNKKEKIKLLLSHIQTNLLPLGYKIYEDDNKTFVRQINDESLGVVDIGILKLGGVESLNVVPIIGVMNYTVENILFDITRLRSPKDIITTVNITIDKLTPFSLPCPWWFRTYEEIIKGANKIAIYTKRYGIKYMKNNATLAGLRKTLGKGHSHILSEYRMPIIYYLMGKNDLAKKFITNELNKLKGRSDLYAQDYTKFANELMRRIVESKRTDL